jgi:hypothetical protein
VDRPSPELAQQLWHAYQATLAELLDDRSWSHIAEAHGKIAAFNGLLTMGRDGHESIHHGNQYIELIDCCDLSEFWHQHLVTTQDPIRSAVEAVHPILHPEDRRGIGRAPYTAQSVSLPPSRSGAGNGNGAEEIEPDPLNAMAAPPPHAPADTVHRTTGPQLSADGT